MALIEFDEAVRLAVHVAPRLASERVPLECADGRVLAEAVMATGAIPPFTHGSMDGYALMTSALDGDGPWELEVRGESRAGAEPPAYVPRAACRSFTGARLPAGCDAVVMQEDVERSEGQIRIPAAARPRPGQHIRMRGADLAEGEVALRAGITLTPGALALAASLDHTHVVVARRPVVAIVSTGDELRHRGTSGGADSIAESNALAVALYFQRAGAVTRIGDFVPDDPEVTRERLTTAMRGADLLVTIGGASVGDHDLVRPALESLGATFEFFGVAMKPGKPTGLGRVGTTIVLCLPGNPASATLACLAFGVPLVLAMQGHARPIAPRPRLRIHGRYSRSGGRTEFLRARLEIDRGELTATLLPNQASGAPTSFAYADALVIVPRDVTEVEPGERLEVIDLSRHCGS
ncbi:MAG: molybdopterin molybdenumtransferase MoeA [Myxococcales bacterium]|nr:molybdopterin molybdenumtransferase MoeA [Myxococcales bacterium]